MTQEEIIQKIRQDERALSDLLRPYMRPHSKIGIDFLYLRDGGMTQNKDGSYRIQLANLFDALWDAKREELSERR